MDFAYAILALAGAVALLLWGAHMVQTGIQRAFGPQLVLGLGRALRSRYIAFLAGISVTILLQSSTATALIATSFVVGAVIDLVPALAIMLGANVGTALIVQVLAFDVVALAPLLVLGGLLMFRRSPSAILHDLGRVAIGLALMLLALHQMLDVIAPFEHSEELQIVLSVLSHVPVLALLFAAGLAWAMHSSIAAVLLVVSLAVHGIVPLDSALVLVLGANLGTAINPVFEGQRTTDPATRRLPVGNLLNRIIGTLLVIGFCTPLANWLTGLGFGPAYVVAGFHLIFNLGTALVALPLLGPFTRLLAILLPTRPVPANSIAPIFLDNSARDMPVVALGGATREAFRLADSLEHMLVAARDTLASSDRKAIAAIREMDNVIDTLNEAINGFLTTMETDALGDSDRARMNQLLTFSMNIEQAGDTIDRALLAHSLKRVRRGIGLSSADEAELRAFMDRLIANLKTAVSLLMSDDPHAARSLAREKETFRQAERDATKRHLASFKDVEAEAARGSAVVLDLLRDMKVINSFIVAAAAYPVLDKAGELLPNRLSSDTTAQ